ncbi:MAG: carbon-nitrogen hydrolase family protein [Actinomycetota bacterium]
MTDRLRIALAQPRVVVGPEPEENVARATDLVARAASGGASLVLFPEGYPGPVLRQHDATYDASSAMAEEASSQGVAVCWSRVELCDDGEYRLVVYVVDGAGRQLIRYPRAHPAAIPPGETGYWVAPGDEGLALFELDGVPTGIVVCSELWVPEPTRVLAIRGAELILSPAGGAFTSLLPNWQLIARARAIENLAYVALTNNIWDGEQGAAMVAGPEHVAAASGTEELIFATLDLGRVLWLRGHDDSIQEPKPFDSIPGLVRFRRPELYGDLAAPTSDLYDFRRRVGVT